MLTPGENAAVLAALAALRAEVERTEAAAVEASNWLARIPLAGRLFEDETTTRARERAELLRFDLEQFTAKWSELFNAQGEDHEAAAQLVEVANRLASRDHPAMTRDEAREAAPLSIARDVVVATVADLKSATAIGLPVVLVIALVVVALLVVVRRRT